MNPVLKQHYHHPSFHLTYLYIACQIIISFRARSDLNFSTNLSYLFISDSWIMAYYMLFSWIAFEELLLCISRCICTSFFLYTEMHQCQWQFKQSRHIKQYTFKGGYIVVFTVLWWGCFKKIITCWNPYQPLQKPALLSSWPFPLWPND